jgi:hypothetical protein
LVSLFLRSASALPLKATWILEASMAQLHLANKPPAANWLVFPLVQPDAGSMSAAGGCQRRERIRPLPPRPASAPHPRFALPYQQLPQVTIRFLV